jgi:hypothetical protein
VPYRLTVVVVVVVVEVVAGIEKEEYHNLLMAKQQVAVPQDKHLLVSNMRSSPSISIKKCCYGSFFSYIVLPEAKLGIGENTKTP